MFQEYLLLHEHDNKVPETLCCLLNLRNIIDKNEIFSDIIFRDKQKGVCHVTDIQFEL